MWRRAGDIKDDSALLLRRDVSRASQIEFRNPQPQINSDAQEFIKEARQSASEKTHVPSPAKPRGQGAGGCIPEGREHSGNRTRVPSEDVASTAPVPPPSGPGQDPKGTLGHPHPQDIAPRSLVFFDMFVSWFLKIF